MSTYHFKLNAMKPNLLHDEVLEAIPRLKGALNADGIYEHSPLTVYIDDNVIIFDVKDSTITEKDISDIVKKHDPTKLTKEEKKQKVKDDAADEYEIKKLKIKDAKNIVNSAKDLKELKDAVLICFELVINLARITGVQQDEED